MPFEPEFLRRLRERMAVNVRWLVLPLGERPLVGQKLSSGAFVPATAFVIGETLWLDPRVIGLVPAGTRADAIVCRDRPQSAWASSGPPVDAIVARVQIDPSAPHEPVPLVERLAPGGYDILLDLGRDGRFDPGDAIQGARGPGIVVHDDPALPGPFRFTRDELDLGLITMPPRSPSEQPRDVAILLTLVKPIGVPRGPLAIIAHGNGYDPATPSRSPSYSRPGASAPPRSRSSSASNRTSARCGSRRSDGGSHAPRRATASIPLARSSSVIRRAARVAPRSRTRPKPPAPRSRRSCCSPPRIQAPRC